MSGGPHHFAKFEGHKVASYFDVSDDHPWSQVCRSRPALAAPSPAHIPDPYGLINLQTFSSFENAALTFYTSPIPPFSISHLHPTHTPSPNPRTTQSPF